MNRVGDIIILERFTKAGIPSVNKYVYTEENFNEMMDDYIFRGGHVAIAPEVINPLGPPNLNSAYAEFNKDAYTKHYCIPIDCIIGHIKSYTADNVTIGLKHSRYENFYDLINPDIKVHFRYITEMGDSNAAYTNIKIIKIIVCDLPIMPIRRGE